MTFDELIAAMQAAQGDRGQMALITLEFTLSNRPPELARAFEAAAIPHWFDAAILAGLLDLDQASAERLFQELIQLPMVERFEARDAWNAHEATRLPLRARLAQEQPERFRELSARAVGCFSGEDSHLLVERLCHQLITDPEAAGEELSRLGTKWRGRVEEQSQLALALRELLGSGVLSSLAAGHAALRLGWLRLNRVHRPIPRIVLRPIPRIPVYRDLLGRMTNVKAWEVWEQLYQRHRDAVFRFICGKGYRSHDAEDLTQGFFVHLLRPENLAGIDPTKVGFRPCLEAALRSYLDRKAKALKRGGEIKIVSLDSADGREARFLADSAPIPGDYSDFPWFADIILSAFLAMGEQHKNKKRWHALRGLLLGELDNYKEVADQLTIPVERVGPLLRRLQEQLAARIRAELAEATVPPERASEELKYLAQILPENQLVALVRAALAEEGSAEA